MNRQTLQAKESAPAKKSSFSWLRPAAAHPAAEAEHEAPSASSPSFAHDFTKVPVRPMRLPGVPGFSCPFAPQRCPSGGACHTCPPKLQAKLKIGQPGDRYEQEADRVAETVMRMPEQQVQRKGCSAPGCKDEDEDKILQGKSAGSAGNAQVDHPLIQSVLSSPGQPLDAGTRSFMEPRFGQDFSGVRVHLGGEAAESARAVNARAYTVGRDVVFGEGQYAPGSDEGKRLVAHELAHVGQQSRSHERGISDRNEGILLDPTIPVLQRQQPSSLTDSSVTEVRLSRDDSTIVFYTSGGSYSYELTTCNIPVGTYTVGVTVSGSTVHFNFGQAATTSQQFQFGFRIEPGQVNPVTLFRHQGQVAVSVVEHLPSRMAATSTSSPELLSSSRLAAFQQLVKNAGKLRLTQNSHALEQWLQFLQHLPPEQVRAGVNAEETRHFLDRAARSGTLALSAQWLQTSGPNRRWVLEQQLQGRYRACTGCHATLQAEEMDRRLLWQRSPIEQLAIDSGLGRQTSSSVVAEAQRHINAIQPYLRQLGPEGYQVLPPETLGSTAPPSVLVADISRRITQRQADYREFSRRIDEPDFDYLQLRPIVRDLLPLADADVRQAVLDAIDSAETWETIEAIVVGVTSIGLLLLAIFPPTSAIGIGGALALGTTLGVHAAYRGYQNFEQGQLYSLGQGADNVLDPAQQEAADSLMAMGALNMILGTVGAASGALGAVRLIRSLPPPGGGLGALETVEGNAGGNLYRVTGWGTRDPMVVVTDSNGQVIRSGPLSSFRPSTSGAPRASMGSTGTASGGYTFPTEGGAARVAQPIPVQEPVPVPTAVPRPVPALPVRPGVPATPGVRGPLATMGVTSAISTIASTGAPSRQPVMPSGLSRADQELWRTCNQQHDIYKATQAQAAAYAPRMAPIAERLHNNRASTQDRVDYCSLLDERIRLLQREHSERSRYIRLDCDRFDWFNEGRTAAERLADHQDALNDVAQQLRNFYALRKRFCP